MQQRLRAFVSRQPVEPAAAGDAAAPPLAHGVIPAVGAAARSLRRLGAVRLGGAGAAGQWDSPVRRARLKAFGALTVVVGAMALTVTTTLDSSGSLRPATPGRLSGASGHSRCCWIVAPGQSLSSIARQEGVGLTELRRVNPGVSRLPGALRPGQRIRIPA